LSKLTESARGQNCQVRIPGICNHDPRTVVLAHINGAGMGMKAPDIHGAYCCSDCHDVLDGRTKMPFTSPDEVKLYHLEGVIRTQKIMLEQGLIKI